ncbi:4Fe-4S dicluster domain-containing protein [Chloroflexota bacterium]
MARYGLIIDMNRCNGCYACFLACRDEYCGNDYLPYSAAQPELGSYWMRIVERERGSFPKIKMAYFRIPCMHCDSPACVEKSPAGAVYKRPDGIVIIDPVKAKGNKDIVGTCPYDVIYWNEQSQLPQKCTFCAHLLDKGWKEPRCVEVCPTEALIFGDLDDPNSKIAQRLTKEKAEVLHPEYNMNEKVLYVGLPKRFIAGSVVFGDTDKCAKDVTVTITGDGNTRTTETNNYGDFEVEELAKDTDYVVTIDHQGYKKEEIKVRTRIDIYLGDLMLSKKN